VPSRLDAYALPEDRGSRDPAVDESVVVRDLESVAVDRAQAMQKVIPAYRAWNDIAVCPALSCAM
jgi:hypothetical protein